MPPRQMATPGLWHRLRRHGFSLGHGLSLSRHHQTSAPLCTSTYLAGTRDLFAEKIRASRHGYEDEVKTQPRRPRSFSQRRGLPRRTSRLLPRTLPRTLPRKALGHDVASTPKDAAISSVATTGDRERGLKKLELLREITGSTSPASHKIMRYGQGGLSVSGPTQSGHHEMNIAETFFEHKCRFLYSAESLRHHPPNDHIPEIVVLGASNVGKSSFLNALVSMTDIARVGQRPGKTKLMNAFGVGPLPKISRELIRKGTAPPSHSLILMDTPGYGFRSQASWGSTILEYLETRKMLRGAVLLLSSEKKLREEDQWILRSLAQSNTRTLVVLTKADKGRGEWPLQCSSFANTLREELSKLERSVGNGWREGHGWTSDVYITAAGMNNRTKQGNGSGMGGVRGAILEMAGFTLEDKVTKQAETTAYVGPIVPFDDIQWKV